MDVAFTVDENERVKKKYKKKNLENVQHIPRIVQVNPPINEAMTGTNVRLGLYPIFALQFVNCIYQPWDSKADVIRIENNGSQIRTIFLPKRISFTHSDPEDMISGHSNATWNAGNQITMNHSTGNRHIVPEYEKGDSTRQIQKTARNNSLDDIVKAKPSHKIQPASFLERYGLQHFIKKRKKVPTNGSLSSKKSHVGLRFSAEKFAKLLNLFTIVNFINENCYTSEGLIGVCYHPVECASIAGQARGTCAQGYGVCCYVERSCGERSAVNNTYVTTTGIARDLHTGVYICSVLIDKTTPDIRQLRLTFDSFVLAGPVDGKCAVDSFVVSGQNRNNIVPPLCGVNTGKHVYVDVDDSEGPVSLTLLSSMAHGVPRDFKIHVTQLRKDDPLLAPNNCLQYFTELQGSLESFNYLQNNTSASAENVTPGYFNNLNYAICFKKRPGYCSIVYTNMGAVGMEYVFELVNTENDGTQTVSLGQAGAELFDCPDDYIVLSGLRLCGFKLNDGSMLLDYSKNSPVTDNTNGPLVLEFHTNNNVTGRGFHLDYTLRPCSSSAHPTTLAPTSTTSVSAPA